MARRRHSPDYCISALVAEVVLPGRSARAGLSEGPSACTSPAMRPQAIACPPGRPAARRSRPQRTAAPQSHAPPPRLAWPAHQGQPPRACARSRQPRRPSATHSGQTGNWQADAVLHAARARIPEVAAVRHADVADPRCAAALSAAIVTFPAGARRTHAMAAVPEIRQLPGRHFAARSCRSTAPLAIPPVSSPGGSLTGSTMPRTIATTELSPSVQQSTWRMSGGMRTGRGCTRPAS